MHDVFISYSSKDTADAERVRQTLETNGISCWIAPRNIPSGSSYAAEIPAAIRGCTIFLLIGSLHAEASPWIRKELERAIIERKKIIPLMVEDVAFQDEFDFLLSLHQRYAAYEKTSETMETLVTDIRAILGMDSPAKTQKALATPRYDSNTPAVAPLLYPRFDGIYMGPAVRQGISTFHNYYRFYPNGVVVSSYSAATPKQAKTWLDENKYDGSRYTEENGALWMTEMLSSGFTYHAKLTIDGHRLLMEGYNNYSKKNITRDCIFVPFDDIK